MTPLIHEDVAADDADVHENNLSNPAPWASLLSVRPGGHGGAAEAIPGLGGAAGGAATLLVSALPTAGASGTALSWGDSGQYRLISTNRQLNKHIYLII